MSFRLLITGSRSWDAHEPVVSVISGYQADHPDLEVVIGDAQGADRVAADACRLLGIKPEIWHARWSECTPECRHRNQGFCPTAGFRRNAAMVASGIDACEAFAMDCTRTLCLRKPRHWSHGTADCAERAEAAGVKVNWNTREETLWH